MERSRRAVLSSLGVGSLAALAGCGADAGPTTPDLLEFRLPAFENGVVPRRFTCLAADGAGVSPPVVVESVPPPTAALGLVIEYPNSVGGTFTHWVLWNLPPDTERIPEGAGDDGPTLDSLGGGRQGQNDVRRVGYVGLCPPPSAEPQEYWVTLYALRRELSIPGGAPRDPFDDAVETATLASKRATATFRRPLPDEGPGTPTRTPLE
jgi:Raf kinase inhibitor-like YbhB/YbcL family protein